MLKRYKNALLKVIESSGLDPADFTGVEREIADFPAFVVTYVPASISFVVRNNSEDPHAFDYGFEGFPKLSVQDVAFLPQNGFCDFDPIQKEFSDWLETHVRSAVDEELLPDLWSEAKAASESSSSNSFESHEVFTEDEKAKVKLAINNFRILLVQQFEPNPQQLASVNDQLEYLVAAVDRLNKFDWKGVATSTLIGISTALTLDVERSRHLYGLFQQAFSSVLRLLN